MVTIEELKLGNRTLEALKFLLSQITELETAISQINISEIKDANTLTKEQIATLQDVKNAVETINSDLSIKKSDFDEKKQNFDTNMGAFRNDKADFDEKKADFDSKNNTALSNFAFISSNVEKINSTSALLAEAKTVLETIKPIEQRTQAVLDTIASSQAKFDELDALKATLLELKRSLENINTTGLISDNTISETTTYSSKKVEDLVSNTKITLVADIKSKTDSLTADMNNQRQSVTTLDSKITATQNSLNGLATGVSGALSQKVDISAYTAFTTKMANDLNNKANKNDVPSVTSLEDTFVKKTDSYSKPEADGKFVEKKDFPVIDKAYVGLGKVDNTADLDKPISRATGVAINNIAEALNDKAFTRDIPNIVRNSLNGLIFQQGTVNVISDSSGNVTVMYPVAFPATPIFVRYTYGGLDTYIIHTLSYPDNQSMPSTKLQFLAGKGYKNKIITVTYAALGY